MQFYGTLCQIATRKQEYDDQNVCDIWFRLTTDTLYS